MKLSGQALPADSLLSWEVTNPHMAIDVTNLHSSEESDAQLSALLQRILVRLDEQAQFQALLAEAIKLLIQGRWDAAQYGPQSVEALLVAYNDNYVPVGIFIMVVAVISLIAVAFARERRGADLDSA